MSNKLNINHYYTYLEVTDQEDWLQRIIHSKVQTPINDDSDTRDIETSVEPNNTIRGKGLLVYIEKTIELSLSATFLDGCGIIGKSGSRVVKRVHEKERRRAGSGARRQVTGKPLQVPITILLEVEQLLEVVLECKVKSLEREGNVIHEN